MRSLVVGTAGHIDHGKSALVKTLTGTDPDRLKEEQARGITIDLGFAHARMGDVDVAFVDVPGHERFVRNMLAGAGGIDAVLLVVAADESVMPQTREHFQICRLLGITRGVVALTKCDLADADTRELTTLEVGELLAGSPLAGAPIVTVSARTGEGLDGLRAALVALVDGSPRQARAGVTRLPVDRVFTVKGFGTVVTGTLVSGEVSADAVLRVLPDGQTVRVRGVQVHGQSEPVAVAPRRVAVNLGAVDAGALARGVTLASEDALAVTRRADVHLELLPGARPLKHGARVRVHHGTSEVIGRVSVAARRDSAAADWRQAGAGELGVEIPPGGEAFVRIRLERPAVLTRNDLIVCRAYSPPITIGGGRVLDPEPPAGGVRRATALDRFARLASRDAPLEAWLDEAGGQGLTARALVRRGGMAPAEATTMMATAAADSRGVVGGDHLFATALSIVVADRARVALASFHTAQPIEPGMPRETLRDAAAPGARPELFDAVLSTLVAAGEVKGTDRLALSTHQATLSADDQATRTAVEAAISTAGLAALDAAGLARETAQPRSAVDAVVRLLMREGRLVRVDTLLVSADALSQLKSEIVELGRQAGAAGTTLDVAAFKTRYSLSRKHAIPLLEWLDRERVTKRVRTSGERTIGGS